MNRYRVVEGDNRWAVYDERIMSTVVWIDNEPEAHRIAASWNHRLRHKVTFTIEVTVDPALANALPGDPGSAEAGDVQGIPPMTGLEVASELMLTDLSRYVYDRWHDKLEAVAGITNVRVESNADNPW